MFREFPDPEDHLEHQAPRGLQELMENQVILVRMEKLVLKDLQASLEPQETLEPEERRETVEKVMQARGGLQVLQDPQDQDSNLPLRIWRPQDSLIWNLFGVYLGYQVPQAPPDHLVFPAPLQVKQHRVLQHSDHQEKMEHLVNLACLAYRVLMANQELLVPRGRRVMRASWVFQEQLEKRVLKENVVYQELKESQD